MRMIPATAIRKIYLVIPLIFLSVSVFAESQPSKILYVGAIAINPRQDAKALADGYSRFGIETKEYQGGYYGQLDTAAGPFFFGIHPKKADAPKKCSASISVVFRVGKFETSLFGLARFDRKKIRTKASLRTFTIQTATKLLSGEEKYEPD